MAEVKYVCTGSCGGSVTEEEHAQGKTTCALETCEKHGQPLEKRISCDSCKVLLKEGEEHCCGDSEE